MNPDLAKGFGPWSLDCCDLCSAIALVEARLHAGGKLRFCAHHADRHVQALRERAYLYSLPTKGNGIRGVHVANR